MELNTTHLSTANFLQLKEYNSCARFFVFCILKLLPLCTAKVRPSEGGSLHPEEAAPGLPAVLLCPQCAAVPQENSHAGAYAGLHAGTGRVSVVSLTWLTRLEHRLCNFRNLKLCLKIIVKNESCQKNKTQHC